MKAPGDRADFATKKIARFMYKLQRQMGDCLDHCDWDRFEQCGQQIRLLCPNRPEVLATVDLFLGMRGLYSGSFRSCLDTCNRTLRLSELGPTMATVAQTIRALVCMQLAHSTAGAREEGLVAVSEGEQISYLLPPCPEKARLLLAAGMTYATLYSSSQEHRTPATRQRAIAAYKECMHIYSSSELTNKNEGMPRSLIKFASCLVQCQIDPTGNLIPQTLSEEDRHLAKSVFDKLADCYSAGTTPVVVKMMRLNAEIDYYIDIGAYEMALDLVQKVEALTTNTGLMTSAIRNIRPRREYIEQHITKPDIRQTSLTLLQQAEIFQQTGDL